MTESVPFFGTQLNASYQFSWFLAGKVLAKFMRAAKESNDEAQYMTLKTDLEFISCVLILKHKVQE